MRRYRESQREVMGGDRLRHAGGARLRAEKLRGKEAAGGERGCGWRERGCGWRTFAGRERLRRRVEREVAGGGWSKRLRAEGGRSKVARRHSTAQHGPVQARSKEAQHSTAQCKQVARRHSTAQHSTVQAGSKEAQHSTAQYSAST